MLESAHIAVLRNSQIFDGLSTRELRSVLRLGSFVRVDAGRVLLREGEPGAEAFVVLRGQARVTREGKDVARVGEGEFLGEMALLIAGRGLRSATVTSVTPLELLVFNPREFSTLRDRFRTCARSIANINIGRTRLRAA